MLLSNFMNVDGSALVSNHLSFCKCFALHNLELTELMPLTDAAVCLRNGNVHQHDRSQLVAAGARAHTHSHTVYVLSLIHI